THIEPLLDTTAAHHRALPSFPTRRSSDLTGMRSGELAALTWGDLDGEHLRINKTLKRVGGKFLVGVPKSAASNRVIRLSTDTLRSEEHTSELQSRENLVCRLLLEKKKNIS